MREQECRSGVAGGEPHSGMPRVIEIRNPFHPILFVLSALLGAGLSARGALYTYTNEAAYLARLEALTYGALGEGFEDDAAWGAVRSTIPGGNHTMTAVTNHGVVWQANQTNSQVTTGPGPAHSGGWGFFALPHGDYANGIRDGFRGTSRERLFGVGGWFSGTFGGRIAFILDGTFIDFGQPLFVGGGHRFYGVIETRGFTDFLIRETEGAIDDQVFIFADDFTFGVFTAASSNAPRFFRETFEGAADPAPLEALGWTRVWDSGAPVASGPAFGSNDNINVLKVTVTNDGFSAFTSAYVYCEHDINEPGGESTLPGNLYGQDSGDVLYLTARPAYESYADAIDVNGARFGVTLHMGQTYQRVAYFAIVLANGTRYALADGINGSGPAPVVFSSHAIDAAVSEWREIIHAGGVPGQRLRLADTPQFLSTNQLQSVTDVGLYVPTRSEPSRFDDFLIEDYTAAPDYADLRMRALTVSGTTTRVTWTARRGRRYELEWRSRSDAPFVSLGSFGETGLPAVTSLSAGVSGMAPRAAFRVRLLPP